MNKVHRKPEVAARNYAKHDSIMKRVTVNEVNSNIIFEGKSWIAAMNEPCLPKRIYGYCMAAADFHILTCLRGQTCPFRRKFHYGKKI